MIAALLLALVAGTDGRDAALARCVDCHPGQTRDWSLTGMTRALDVLDPGELEGLEPVVEASTGFRYAFEGNSLIETHVEHPQFRRSATVAFAIGAGRMDRSYVLRRGGRAWLAPLEVLGEAGSRHAAFAPSSAISPGMRFAQPVTPECLSCHTDAPPELGYPLNLIPRGWTPRGISCAGCHGGVVEHVAWQEVPETEREGRDPVTDPAPVDRVARMEACAACHLQGDARIELVPGRVGPPPPGTDLLASRAVFVALDPTDEIGFVSQVQRLVRSRCYTETAGDGLDALACTTCHDPHRSAVLPGERERVREGCFACHPRPGGAVVATAPDCASPMETRPADRDCVDCHMRRTGVFDVAEVAIHDHFIRRDSPPPSPARPLRFPESPTGDWTVFGWPDRPRPAHADDPGLWTMALAHGGHTERALERASKGASAFADRLPMLHHVRGSLFERNGRLPEAAAEYRRALELDPDLAESAVNLAPLIGRMGDLAEARRRLDELRARYPRSDAVLRNRALVRLAQEDHEGVWADLEAAMNLLEDPTLARALARLAIQTKDGRRASHWDAEARRLDPR
jgi:predicted CXXCH cytochrome family protein